MLARKNNEKMFIFDDDLKSIFSEYAGNRHSIFRILRDTGSLRDFGMKEERLFKRSFAASSCTRNRLLIYFRMHQRSKSIRNVIFCFECLKGDLESTNKHFSETIAIFGSLSVFFIAIGALGRQPEWIPYSDFSAVLSVLIAVAILVFWGYVSGTRISKKDVEGFLVILEQVESILLMGSR